MSAILDGNITTIIGALVLIIVGASSIKSFGITLLIGIILSILASLFLTRLVGPGKVILQSQNFADFANRLIPFMNFFKHDTLVQIILSTWSVLTFAIILLSPAAINSLPIKAADG